MRNDYLIAYFFLMKYQRSLAIKEVALKECWKD